MSTPLDNLKKDDRILITELQKSIITSSVSGEVSVTQVAHRELFGLPYRVVAIALPYILLGRGNSVREFTCVDSRMGFKFIECPSDYWDAGQNTTQN